MFEASDMGRLHARLLIPFKSYIVHIFTIYRSTIPLLQPPNQMKPLNSASEACERPLEVPVMVQGVH